VSTKRIAQTPLQSEKRRLRVTGPTRTAVVSGSDLEAIKPPSIGLGIGCHAEAVVGN